jgi:ribokinase
VRTVIITLGEEGAFWATRTQIGTMPGFRVPAVDTTAAGDAFNSGLAVAQARGDDLELAVRCACAVSTLAVIQYGA